MTVKDILNIDISLLIVAFFIILLLINLFKRILDKKEEIGNNLFMSKRISMEQGKKYIFQHKTGLFSKGIFEVVVDSPYYHEMFITESYKGEVNIEITLYTDDMVPMQRIAFYDVKWEVKDIN